MAQGVFITFEGPEGSGKSTHIRLLAEALRARGVETLLTREPGGTPLGEAIRDLLQHNASGEPPDARTEVLLFLASRAQHVRQCILPALESGRWVLCDRFEDSTFAYQGFGRGFALDTLRQVNAFATGGLRPDLTLLLDIVPETSRERLQERHLRTAAAPDRIEREDRAFHARMREGFLELARREPQRVARIASDRDVAAVAADVLRAVEARFFSA